MSRHTMSVQAAGAGSHSPRVGGGGRVAVFRAALVSTRTVLEILPSYLRCCPPNISSVTRDHDDCANSLTGGGVPTHFAGHVLRPHLHTGIPAYRLHRAVAGDNARRQNSS